MKFRFTARTDVGNKRPHNEDSYLVDKGLRLFVVCDGMGGHAAGEVASSLAVRVVRQVIAKTRDKLGKLADGTVSERKDLRAILRDAVRMASLKIYKDAQAEDDLRGMGTTLTMMLLVNRRAFVAQVGDSRLYLYRGGTVHQITTDHSMLNQLISSGEIDPEDAADVPFTNALTRAVGVHPDVDVDTFEVDLLPEDILLLCSDGLHNYFNDDEQIVEGLERDFDEAADWFIDFALDAGGKDNITAIVVEIEEAGDQQATARLKLTLDTLRRIPLFKHLSYAELVRVINVSRAREVQPGDVIIQQDDATGDALYIVLEGSVSVEQNGQLVATLGPGRHFGEMSLVDNEPRSATVIAAETSVLIRVVRRDFYNLLREDSVVAVKLLWNFIQNLSYRLRSGAKLAAFESVDPMLETLEHPYDDPDKSFTSEAYAKTDPNIVLPTDEFDV